MCARCRRPESVCYCRHLPRLETRTRVVILQHPRERHMPIGTARMASLCLPGAALHVGVAWDDSAPLAAALADPARPPILLYPGAGARDILRDPPAGPVTLIVIDGTWSQAKTVVRDNPVLAALPRYAFDAPEASAYRIRREPRVEYVSTIEALMHVLGALEDDAPRFRALLDPFRAMVDAQLEHQGRLHGARTRKPRPPRTVASRLPAAIVTRPQDLVCVSGEANAWPYVEGDLDRGGDELVHLAAHRLVTGETFSMIVAPQRSLSPTTTFHTGLDEDTLRRGGTRADLDAAVARFLRPDDVLCAWGHYVTNLWGTLPAPLLDLRAAAQRFSRGKPGGLEAYAAKVAPARSPSLAEGRAGRRLAMLRDIIASWRAAADAADGDGPA